MSKYTTEVRTICENYAGYPHYSGEMCVSHIIEKSRTKIFDFSYPIFDEKYRSVLETKILKHYYTREIGLETVGLWKLKLDTEMNEIMPYYNQLYKSTLLEFNPFYDVDITRKHTSKNDGTRNETSSSNSNGKSNNSNKVNETSRDLYSDTPQGALTGVESETYLTNARKVASENSSNGENTFNSATNGNTESVIKNTEDYLETVKGKQGTQNYSDLLLKYRETFLNIDIQIIEELSDLFMNLW